MHSSKRRRVDAVDTLADVLEKVISIPRDVLIHIRMYLYRVTTPRLGVHWTEILHIFGRHRTREWAGTERMRRRNIQMHEEKEARRIARLAELEAEPDKLFGERGIEHALLAWAPYCPNLI